MKNPKHHIIPRYRCEELGIDPDFDENIVEVTREDHALIHWGYKCNDLEPLFEHITPAQWIIDLIPRGDNRDVCSAIRIVGNEIDGIDMSGENNPRYKDGIYTGQRDWFNWPEKNKERRRAAQRTPEYREKARRREKTPERKAYKKKYDAERYVRLKTEKKKYDAERYVRKKLERQGVGTLEGFLE